MKDLLTNIGIPSAKVVHIPNSVNTEQYRPPTLEEKLMARTQLRLPAKHKVVLYVGRLEWVKGVDILLRAWAMLPAAHSINVQLIIVGNGRARTELSALAALLDVDANVRFVGLQNNVRDWYWGADIFALPSRSEGLSNALIEAMACGLPVVASKVGGTPDVVEEGSNGLMCEAEDDHQLARKLASIIEMQDRWDEMGALGRQTIESFAGSSEVVEKLDRLYRQMINSE
jgi:glycosyltransferase involved in cell wall biosynthesis